MKLTNPLVTALCLTLVALLCLPLAGCKKDTVTIDLTKESVAFAQSLSLPVDIYWLCEGNATDEYTQDLLKKYTKANDNIRLTVVDPLSGDANATRLQSTYGKLANKTLIIECAATGRHRTVTMDDLYYYTNDYITSQYADYLENGEIYKISLEELEYQIEFNAREQGFDLLANSTTVKYFGGEAAISSALDYVTSAEVKETVYVLTSHGHGISADLMTQLNLKTVDLTATDALPSDAGCLIMSDPSSDLTPRETELVSAYLLSGGSLLLTTANGCEQYTNLMSLCNIFGLTSKTGVVSDASLAIDASVPTTIYPRVNVQSDIGAIAQQYQILLPLASPHSIQLPEKDALPEKVGIASLFHSSDKAILLSPTDPSVTLDSSGNYCLAVTATKSLADDHSATAVLTWYAAAHLFDKPVSKDAANPHLIYMAGSLNTMITPFVSRFQNQAGIVLPLDISVA